MKTFSDLFSGIASFEALHAAWLRTRRGRTRHGDILDFERDLESNLLMLQRQLASRTYKTGPYKRFLVFEPKERLVSALPVKDRVVQHALVAAIEPIWEARFIHDSYACRLGKGTHRGADRAQALMRQVKRRHGLLCALKGDIAKCFPSIAHDILKRLLRRHLACDGALWLCDEIVDSAAEPGDVFPRGIPIGNLSSQLFANIYLHELDMFIKQDLRWPHYMRYMDDWVLFAPDKGPLHEARRAIEDFLHADLALRTNRKTQVFRVGPAPGGRCLDYLGYRIWPTHRRLRPGCIKRVRRRLKGLARRYHEGRATIAEIDAVVASWLGHAAHADTHTLRGRVLADLVLVPQRRRDACARS